MSDHTSDGHRPRSHDDYIIHGHVGYFTVSFTSPFNSTHQISGFKTEDDAQSWIAEAKLLIGTYR
jgi:hypothetical protein